MSATDFFGLAGCGLLCLALVAVAAPLQRLRIGARVAVMLAVAAAVFAPIGDLSIAAYARGVTGDLSVPTLVLAGGAFISRMTGRNFLAPRESGALLWLLAGAGLFLYPFALGFTPFDPYALGYGSIAFVTVLLLVTLAAWRAGLNLIVVIVVAAALACLAGAYESRNVWDYLIDPLVATYALARQVLELARRAYLSVRERASR